MIDLAFLAPDLIRDALDGKQPLGFTSDWCLRHNIPSAWSEQRALLSNSLTALPRHWYRGIGHLRLQEVIGAFGGRLRVCKLGVSP